MRSQGLSGSADQKLSSSAVTVGVCGEIQEVGYRFSHVKEKTRVCLPTRSLNERR